MLSTPPSLLTIGLCALAMAGGAALLTTPTTGDLNSYFSPESLKAGATCPGKPGDGEPAVDDFRAEWYAKVWRAADEPSLYLQSQEAKASSRRTYRFTLLPSFRSPAIVRLDERPDGRFRMTATRLFSPEPTAPGHRTTRIERILTVAESQGILNQLENSKVMSLAPAVCDQGADGSHWIIEGIEGGQLHYADRWAPEAGPIRDVGIGFLALAGWNADPR